MSGGDRQVFDCGCVFWSDAQAGERCDVCPACREARTPTLDADTEWRKSQEMSAATIRRGAALRRRRRPAGLRALLRNAWSDLLGALGYGLTRKERKALEARLARHRPHTRALLRNADNELLQ